MSTKIVENKKNLTVRRYTDVLSLLYILRNQKITLLDPQFWDDTNDSHYLELYRNKNNFQSVLALCFTQADEKYHHWRIFSNGTGGVCIQFDLSQLQKASQTHETDGNVRTKTVEYMTLRKMREAKGVNNKDLPFIKRQAFKDEHEYRIIYESKKEKCDALDISIPLSCIKRITLSPWAPEPLRENLKMILKSIDGCSGIEIFKSTLISNKEWKNFGDAAA